MSGRVLQRFGTGVVTFVSALLTGLSLLGLSQVPNFPLMVALAFPLGLGAGSVDAGLNHFVAEHYSSRHMNWLHACWGIGATLGPVIMGSSLASSSGWSGGYRVLAIMQLSLAGLLLLSLGWWSRQGPTRPNAEQQTAAAGRQTPRYAPVLAASLFTVYAAVEMGTGLWAASVLQEARHFTAAQAGVGLTLYYGAIMSGRVVVGFVSDRIGNRRLVRAGLLVALVGVVLMLLPGLGLGSLSALILLGLGCAPIYPSLMHETPRRFEPHIARRVIGWQVAAANIGGAIMPAAFGLLAAIGGLELIFPAIGGFVLLLLLLSARLDKVS